MKIYNTLSRRKEEFSPQGDEVRMYVCGVTPYDEAHIGHAMSYINFDVIRRYLIVRGYRVKYVQNITDIDDKIINRAAAKGVSTAELAARYERSFTDDMAAMNIAAPDETPHATGEIDAIIEMIQGLVDEDYAYAAKGSVYFRVHKAAGYGKLSNRSPDSLLAGARVQTSDEKEEPGDFVLWKASKPGEPSWPSPWGPGRPGWHIECSAMSLKYLGQTIDIHGGGQDLIFPHHENEIAQSESFTGKKPFVKYWLHNGLLRLGEEKMSKSLGNLITIKEALGRYSADAIRLFVLGSHYRHPLTYSEEALEAAEKAAERLRQAVSLKGGETAFDWEQQIQRYRQAFTKAMDDDFNAPRALAAVFNLARVINRQVRQGMDAGPAVSTLKELAGVLGLMLEEPPEGPLDDEKMAMIQRRNELRAAKKWLEADEMRARLAEAGIILEDTSSGTSWKRKH
ncbi:MAG: cysteine--tRNA ligase [Dehalococcoidales bacterium]